LISIDGTYELKWKLKLEANVPKWSNTFRFTTGTTNAKKHGDRIIALFISSSNAPHLCVENK